jgi:hypothetical protein
MRINNSGDMILSGTLGFGSSTQQFSLYLLGTDYGFGINSGVLRYNAGTTPSPGTDTCFVDYFNKLE